MTYLSPTTFQKMLLTWFDKHGRKDLPWQQNKTPYRVWVSEIMLQQTQVTTVIPYFLRFMTRFPNIQTLARAEEDEVLHLWTGLGYYSRARNLHRTAKIICQEYSGAFPQTLDALVTLPGIGQSTAGAILTLAMQQKATILDGNVKRVLTRLHGITQWPGEKAVLEQLWQIATRLTPNKRVDDYTQAIMDMGATLCVRGQPLCPQCPFAKHCLAHRQGIEKSIPQAKPRKTLPVREATMLILQHQQHVLLQKRPQTGIWGGLWSLPELSGTLSEKTIQAACKAQFKLTPKHISLQDSFRHTFSHFHLDILPAVITLRTRPAKIIDSEEQIWYNLQQSQTVGLPAPVKKLLRELT